MRLEGYGLPPEHETEIQYLYENGHISCNVAIDIAARCNETGMSPTEIWAEEGYCMPVSEAKLEVGTKAPDTEGYVAAVMAENPEERDENKLLGLTMKRGRGMMNPVVATEEIRKILKIHR